MKTDIKTDSDKAVGSGDLLGIYGGYQLARSGTHGGKAGRGHNKTSTIQVREPAGDGYFLKTQFRYQTGNSRSESNAIMKARAWVDAQMPNVES